MGGVRSIINHVRDFVKHNAKRRENWTTANEKYIKGRNIPTWVTRYKFVSVLARRHLNNA